MGLYLIHHGIKGQKWGVRNGPPYPLEGGGHSSVKVVGSGKQKAQLVSNLNAELNKFDYGVVVNNKKYTNLDEVPWDKYKTMTMKQMEKHRCGICWDFVNYQHQKFKDLGIKDDSYLFVKQLSDDPNDIVTHTFSVIKNGNKKQWFESSWMKHQGVHDIKDYKDVIKTLDDHYGDRKGAFDVYKYNPDGMMGISNGAFFRRATENDPIFKRA